MPLDSLEDNDRSLGVRVLAPRGESSVESSDFAAAGDWAAKDYNDDGCHGSSDRGIRPVNAKRHDGTLRCDKLCGEGEHLDQYQYSNAPSTCDKRSRANHMVSAASKYISLETHADAPPLACTAPMPSVFLHRSHHARHCLVVDPWRHQKHHWTSLRTLP